MSPFAADDQREMGRGKRLHRSALSSITVDARLEQLKRAVESRLPWVSREDGRPVGMRVIECGYTQSEFEAWPVGTPYVLVGAAGIEAASAVCDALEDFARLSEAYWVAGWSKRADGELAIRIYPPEDVDKIASAA